MGVEMGCRCLEMSRRAWEVPGRRRWRGESIVEPFVWGVGRFSLAGLRLRQTVFRRRDRLGKRGKLLVDESRASEDRIRIE